MNIEIANRLVNLRKSNNFSQEALAEKLGISRQAVSKWERAEASPDTDNLILLSRLYGISLDELLKTEDEIPTAETELPGGEQKNEKEELAIQEDKEENSFDERKKSYIEEDNDEERTSKLGEICDRIPMLWIIILAYLITGCVFDAWYVNWILFLVIPIWNSLLVAIERKNAYYFSYPVLVTLVYLFLGFYYYAWHPGWIIYLTIPVYYSVAGRI